MTDVEVNFGGAAYLLCQAALLVLYYGGIYPNLPWWVVWFPTLLVGGILGVGLIFFFVVIIIATVIN